MKTKLHFIFQGDTTPGLTENMSLASSKLIKFLTMITPDVIDTIDYIGVEHKDIMQAQMIDSDTFDCPYEVSVDIADVLCEGTMRSDSINVFVIPWSKDFMMLPKAKECIAPLHDIQDNNNNVVLLADYSHESMIPGPVGTHLLATDIGMWLQPQRYLMCMLSAEQPINMASPVPFKDITYSSNYVTATLLEMIEVEDNLKQRPIHSWPGKTGKFKYINPNRIGRQHRLDLIVKMHQRDMLFDCEWSMMIPDQDNLADSEYFNLFGTAPRYMSKPWHWWSSMKNESEQRGGPIQTMPNSLADSGLVYIVQDTFLEYKFGGGGPTNRPIDPNMPMQVYDVSEKILKPLIYGLPFFYSNRLGTVDMLRKLGFWMPGGDYNNVQDPNDRQHALLDAAAEFEDTISQKTVELLEHNKQLILSKQLHYDISGRALFEAIHRCADNS